MLSEPDQIARLPETDAFSFSCRHSSLSPLTEAETTGESVIRELTETAEGADVVHLLAAAP